MNAFAALVNGVTDPYERKARLFPGLLVISPLLILLCCAVGPKYPLLTSVIAAASTFGFPFAIAVQARLAGKRLEEELLVEWGGWPSTIVLRHRDSRYDKYTKLHYHQELSRRFDIALPSDVEERADPADADQRYTAVSTRLRLSLRGGKHPHLLRENIAYGFYRNALALKVPGLCVSVVSLLSGAMIAGALAVDQPYFVKDHLLHPGYPIAISMGFSLVMVAFWSRLTGSHVKRVSFAYADRLYECLDDSANTAQRPETAQGQGAL
jgi:hypothetical protein